MLTTCSRLQGYNSEVARGASDRLPAFEWPPCNGRGLLRGNQPATGGVQNVFVPLPKLQRVDMRETLGGTGNGAVSLPSGWPGFLFYAWQL